VKELDQEKEELSSVRRAAGQDGGGRQRGWKVGEKLSELIDVEEEDRTWHTVSCI